MNVRIATALSAAGLALIATFEGLSNYAYKDIVGVPTICYGHTSNVSMGDYKTTKECTLILKEESKGFSNSVLRHAKVPLSQGELDAYTSFAYNVGEGAFRNSTLLRLLNQGKREEACDQLLRWVYAGGKRVQGLYNRRVEERKLCLSGVQSLKSP